MQPPHSTRSRSEPPIAPASRASRARRQIMVVDDEPDFCAVVGELLRRANMEVHKAYSVEEALALLKEITPDLILADVMMPETDGLVLIRRLRSHPQWKRIPTIVVSARVRYSDRSAALRAGADAFLPKPFSIRELRAAIDTYLG